MQMKHPCLRTLLSLTVVAALLLSSTVTIFAQESDPETQNRRLFMPVVQSEEEAVTQLELTADEVAEVTAGTRLRTLPASMVGLKLATSERLSNAPATLKLDASLHAVAGKRRVVVRLSEPAVGAQLAAAVTASAAQLQAQANAINAQQAAVLSKARQLDANVRLLASAQKAVNVVVLEMEATALAGLAADSAVLAIRPLRHYEKALSETVPYIGATSVQEAGYTGAGIKVAVFDSGIDYFHAALGGSGDPAEYAENDPTVIEPGTFPTAKVVGGYDFVGSEWSGGSDSPDELPDPDPLDDGPEAGHGTHVAHIIGGDGGVAPDVDLYAVKVCSSVSTSCSGLALIQAMEWALDPNGDGDFSDRMDIINMSLGSNYGLAFDDDLSYAVDVASALGVLTVASAGNGSDKPFVTGTPAAAPSALSVAQTNVPSALQDVLEVLAPAEIADIIQAVFQPWAAPLTATIEGPLQYADGAGGNLNGCAPFAEGSLTGKIVMVDRGGCFFSDKVRNVALGGGSIGIIALIAPGDPFQGGFGGGDPITIPGYMISQADAAPLKAALTADETVTVRFDPASGLPLIGHMVGSSSRGPSMESFLIKPEIGAPGASISAVAGSGDGVEPFGGTSGAAPMVSGAAALLLQAYPGRSPAEIKSLLMNTAETDIMNSLAEFGGDLAPITRIGNGEVRVDRALAAVAAAWDAEGLSGALSFAFHDVTQERLVLERRVHVQNYSSAAISYAISSTFRFADDEASGAVAIEAPASVTVPANGSTQFKVKAIIHGARLGNWGLTSGGNGANPAPLTAAEYDGYLTLMAEDDAANTLHLGWHILPRKANDVTLRRDGSRVKVYNRGVGTATVESYSLIAFSPNLPEGGPGELNPTPDFRYVGYATFPVPAGFCSDDPSFVMTFALNTREPQTHANAPNSFEIYLDTNQDGTPDYLVINRDVTLTDVSDGRNLSWVVNLATGDAEAFFFTDHQAQSNNTVLPFCGEQIGMNAANFGQPMDLIAFANDYYFGGNFDQTGVVTIAPLGERYLGIFASTDNVSSELPFETYDWLKVLDFGPSPVSRDERGLLLLYRGGAPADQEAGVVIVR
jgi:subtilisin family serine protease